MSNEELAVLIRAGVDVPENMAALYEQNKGMIACPDLEAPGLCGTGGSEAGGIYRPV